MPDLLARLRNRPNKDFDADNCLIPMVPYDTKSVDDLLDEAIAEIERLTALTGDQRTCSENPA